jgi:hypothetical protein
VADGEAPTLQKAFMPFACCFCFGAGLFAPKQKATFFYNAPEKRTTSANIKRFFCQGSPQAIHLPLTYKKLFMLYVRASWRGGFAGARAKQF